MNTLEKHIASQICNAGLKSAKLLLAVSGGRDSMTLLNSMLQIAPLFRLSLYVGHFHHGRKNESTKILKFRDQALKLIEKKCTDTHLPLYFEIHQGQRLKSEDESRKLRWAFLKKIYQQLHCQAIVTAHHRDDLLETRLLRLIRGVGQQGLPSMSVFHQSKITIFRPLLCIPQKTLYQAYIEPIEYIEDPSNQSDAILRNWIRHHWLSDLEKQSPGATQALSRSLDLLSQQDSFTLKIENYLDSKGIKRKELESLSPQQKRQVIATYLCQKNIAHYTSSHIFEIQKRLQTPQKKFEFWLLKHRWIVTPFYISLLEK